MTRQLKSLVVMVLRCERAACCSGDSRRLFIRVGFLCNFANWDGAPKYPLFGTWNPKVKIDIMILVHNSACVLRGDGVNVKVIQIFVIKGSH
jgi:hypothetical protein